MNNRREPILYLISLFLLLSGISLSAAEIRLVNDPFPPYVIGSDRPGSAVTGIAPRIVSKVFKKIPHTKIHFEIMPWSRCLREVKEGERDGLLHLIYSNKRKDDYIFTVPYMKVPLRIVYLKSKFPSGVDWIKFEDLKQYLIVGTEGYSYGAKVDQLLENHTIKMTRFTHYHDSYNHILARRGELFFSNLDVAKDHIKKNKLEAKIGISNIDIDYLYYRMAFSKKSPYAKKIELLNKAIVETVGPLQ